MINEGGGAGNGFVQQDAKGSRSPTNIFKWVYVLIAFADYNGWTSKSTAWRSLPRAIQYLLALGARGAWPALFAQFFRKHFHQVLQMANREKTPTGGGCQALRRRSKRPPPIKDSRAHACQ